VSAARLIEQALQGAGGDSPSIRRDMARRTTPAVRALRLKVLAGEIDKTLCAERRPVSAWVFEGVVVRNAGLDLVLPVVLALVLLHALVLALALALVLGLGLPGVTAKH